MVERRYLALRLLRVHVSRVYTCRIHRWCASSVRLPERAGLYSSRMRTLHAAVFCSTCVERPPARKLWDNWTTGKGERDVEARIARGARSVCWRGGAKMTLTYTHAYIRVTIVNLLCRALAGRGFSRASFRASRGRPRPPSFSSLTCNAQPEPGQ